MTNMTNMNMGNDEYGDLSDIIRIQVLLRFLFLCGNSDRKEREAWCLPTPHLSPIFFGCA